MEFTYYENVKLEKMSELLSKIRDGTLTDPTDERILMGLQNCSCELDRLIGSVLKQLPVEEANG